MALTANFASKIITSDASITDVVDFHMALRDIEDDPAAMIYPVIHTYKEIDLGSGAKFPAVAFVNGWTLQFPAGNFEIRGGNVAAPINPVAGCYVKYTASAAYAVTSIGAGGATPEDISTAVRASLAAELTLVSTIAKIQKNKMVTDPASGTLTVYDDDGTTPLISGPIFEDAAGTQPYRGKGAERRERLT